MRSIICVLLAALAFAAALPSDQVAPDDEFVEAQGIGTMMLQDVKADTEDVNDTLLMQATARVHSLMAEGKDDSACRTLATSEQKTIEDAVKTQQKMLDSISTGKKCREAGQDGVKKANQAKTDADKALGLAKTASSSAENVQIDFGKRTLNSMSGACAISKKDSKYVAAMAKVDAAKKTTAKAEGAAKSAAKALVDAEKAAKKEKHDCECNVQQKQAAAWKSVSKKNSNAEDYAKATNMLCVLDGKKSCPAKTCPSLKKPTVQAGVKLAVCGVHEWQAPPKTLCNQVKGYMQGPVGVEGGRQFKLFLLPKVKRNWAGHATDTLSWYIKACKAHTPGAIPVGSGSYQNDLSKSPGNMLSMNCPGRVGADMCMGMPKQWGDHPVQAILKHAGFTDYGKGIVTIFSDMTFYKKKTYFYASGYGNTFYPQNGDELSAVCGVYVGGHYKKSWVMGSDGKVSPNGAGTYVPPVWKAD